VTNRPAWNLRSLAKAHSPGNGNHVANQDGGAFAHCPRLPKGGRASSRAQLSQDEHRHLDRACSRRTRSLSGSGLVRSLALPRWDRVSVSKYALKTDKSFTDHATRPPGPRRGDLRPSQPWAHFPPRKPPVCNRKGRASAHRRVLASRLIALALPGSACGSAGTPRPAAR